MKNFKIHSTFFPSHSKITRQDSRVVMIADGRCPQATNCRSLPQKRHLSEIMPLNTATKNAIRNFGSVPISMPQLSSVKPRRIKRSQPSPTEFTRRDHHHCVQPYTTSVTRRRQKKPIFYTNQTYRSTQFAAIALATATIMTSMTHSSTANAFIVANLVGAKGRTKPTKSSSLVGHASIEMEDKVIFDKIFEFEMIGSTIPDKSSSMSVATTAATSWTSPEEHHYSLRKILVRITHDEQ